MKKYVLISIILLMVLPYLVMSQTPPPDPNDEFTNQFFGVLGKVAGIAITIALFLSFVSVVSKKLKTKI